MSTRLNTKTFKNKTFFLSSKNSEEINYNEDDNTDLDYKYQQFEKKKLHKIPLENSIIQERDQELKLIRQESHELKKLLETLNETVIQEQNKIDDINQRIQDSQINAERSLHYINQMEKNQNSYCSIS